jgi:hypothetical protein
MTNQPLNPTNDDSDSWEENFRDVDGGGEPSVLHDEAPTKRFVIRHYSL